MKRYGAWPIQLVLALAFVIFFASRGAWIGVVGAGLLVVGAASKMIVIRSSDVPPVLGGQPGSGPPVTRPDAGIVTSENAFPDPVGWSPPYPIGPGSRTPPHLLESSESELPSPGTTEVPQQTPRVHPVAGAVVLTLGLVILVLGIGAGALAVLGDPTRAATIVMIDDDGWCTYDWDGLPRPLAGADGDWCPDGARVGDQADIVVWSDGSAWTTRTSIVSTLLPAYLLVLLVIGVLIGTGLWLRRRVAKHAYLAPAQSSPDPRAKPTDSGE